MTSPERRMSVAVYPATLELGVVWAELKGEAMANGRALDTADARIAATAVVLDVPLVTHNAKDFDFPSRLKIRSFAAK